MIQLSFFSVVACLLLLLLNGCSDNPSSIADPRTRPPLIRTATVQAAQEKYRDFTGIEAARFQGDLGFRVSGKVLERLVNKRQSVKRGQLLMRLDPVDLVLQARARQTSDDEQRYRGPDQHWCCLYFCRSSADLIVRARFKRCASTGASSAECFKICRTDG